MKQLRILALAATALLGAATAASAQQAFTTNDVSLRAGPGTRYPMVRMIPEDAVVYVHGCLRNWDWCDVSWRRSRGWVFSDYLEALYHNRRIGFDEWRDYVDIPFVSFGFGYWDRYYRDRPWYGNWERWGDRNDRHWRNHHRDGGDADWNRTEGNDNRNGTRADNNDDEADRTTRRNRGGDDGDKSQDRMRCAPDDPTCGNDSADDGGDRGDRGHRRNQQMDQQMQ